MSNEQDEKSPAEKSLTRKEFIKGVAATTGILASSWLTGCGLGEPREEPLKEDRTETIKNRLKQILGENTVQNVTRTEGTIIIPKGDLAVFCLPDASLKKNGIPRRQVGMLQAEKELVYSYSLITVDQTGKERRWNAFLASCVPTTEIFKFRLDDQEKIATAGEGWAWTQEGYQKMLEEAREADELVVLEDKGPNVLLFTPAVD